MLVAWPSLAGAGHPVEDRTAPVGDMPAPVEDMASTVDEWAAPEDGNTCPLWMK